MNPEQLLVMAVSSCQLLSFLAFAARARIDVVDYEDDAEGIMPQGREAMRMERISLAPVIRVAPGTNHERVRSLVEEAHHSCYISNSLACPVTVDPTVLEAPIANE